MHPSVSETQGSFAPQIPRDFQFLHCQSLPGRCQLNCEGVCPDLPGSVNNNVVEFTGTELARCDPPHVFHTEMVSVLLSVPVGGALHSETGLFHLPDVCTTAGLIGGMVVMRRRWMVRRGTRMREQ